MRAREIRAYTYLRDPAAITRKSLAIVRAEANLTRFPPPLRRVAARIAHAAGDVAILDDLAFSAKAARAGKAALEAGAPILVDATMVMAGINREQLTAANEILCFLRDPAVPEIAAAQSTTRSAAAVELWRPYLEGAVVAIGNAPTALFRLLEILAEGAGKPALILGFPVGFVGAAEAKAALAAFGNGIDFITLLGRRGGSAMAAAAVNALASADEGLARGHRHRRGRCGRPVGGGAHIDRDRGNVGRRQAALGMVPSERSAERLVWERPLARTIDTIAANRGRRVVVLASGDPLWYGVGAVLTRRFPPDEMIILPQPGAFSLAAARLGWPLADCADD